MIAFDSMANVLPKVTLQCGYKCKGFPVTVGDVTLQTLAFVTPPTQRGHVGFDPCFINEDQTRRIDPCLILLPPIALPCDVRSLLLSGVNCFF